MLCRHLKNWQGLNAEPEPEGSDDVISRSISAYCHCRLSPCIFFDDPLIMSFVAIFAGHALACNILLYIDIKMTNGKHWCSVIEAGWRSRVLLHGSGSTSCSRQLCLKLRYVQQTLFYCSQAEACLKLILGSLQLVCQACDFLLPLT